MKTITITKTIAAPPSGWRIEDRKPNIGEVYKAYCFYGPKEIAWASEHIGQGSDFYDDHLICAYRIRKQKRLMTPQELAGKWLHGKNFQGVGCSWLVSSITENFVQGSNPEKWEPVDCLCEQGVLWSDTPTSERRSLEVEQ